MSQPEPQNPSPSPPTTSPADAERIPPQSGGRFRLSLPVSQARAVWVILVLNIIIFVIPALGDLLNWRILGLSPSDLVLALGAKENSRIYQNGEYYRLITAMFLHGGWLHIAFNSWALYALGPEVERIYGTPRFLALYGLSGLAGSVASYALTPAASVGASGAIFGLIGALVAFYYASRQTLGELARQMLGNLITVIMINLFIGFSSGGLIDNTAHVGGLIGGIVIGWLLAPRLEVDARLYPPVVVRRNLPLAWPGAVGILVILIVAIMVIVPPIQ